MDFSTNKDDASYDAAQRYSEQHTHRQHVVIVPRPATRTKTGGIHMSSKRAIIRHARAAAPQYKDAAVVEIFYGTGASYDSVVRFDPDQPANYGF